MLLTLFPVPPDDTVPDLKRDGVFHILFVLYNDRRRKHDKFVVLFPYAFVLEDLAAVIGENLLARLAKRLNHPVPRGLAALYLLERLIFDAGILLVCLADHASDNQNRRGNQSRKKTNLAAFV